MIDVVVIGGGPAGMAAAIESANQGSKTLLVERNEILGGILNQCIHNGFGLAYFHEELTGPEYAHKFVEIVKKTPNLKVMTSTFVTNIDKRKITITSPKGIETIDAKAVVLSMGARERTAANIMLQGTRPVGVLSAGQAQKMTNIQGKMPGKNIVILGSGDIGLIMARRLTLEGAKVKAVLEINKTPSGLRRNIVQCLEDFKIPLLMQTTITEVVGENRVEGIYISKVDDNYNLVGEQKFVPCDCVILSVGLIPETDLTCDIELQKTNGPVVDDNYQTTNEGVFACGNFLHIHDLVDNVSLEAKDAGKNAALFAQGKLAKTQKAKVVGGNKISYVVPSLAGKGQGKFVCRFRFKERFERSFVVVKNQKGEVVAKKYILAGIPGEMQSIEIDRSLLCGETTVEVEQ